MDRLTTDQLRLASVIAHQLKAPVAAVATILQTLLGDFAGPLNPKQREMLEKALARCHESTATAQRLLTLANALENPKLLAGSADPVAAAYAIHKTYAEEALKRHIHFTLDLGNESPLAWVRLDPAALMEIFDALIHNALKYTPDHGKIRLRIRRDAEPGMLFCSVADSGIGIAPQDRDKIFTPFYRSASARKSARPGTGIGLAFVKSVVEAVGGTIRIATSDLGGAEFQIHLPAQAFPSTPATGDSAMYRPLKVIIVGGVAAGPKVAAKVMRLMPHAEVTIIDKGKLLSYAGCGLPYYISGVVRDQSQLTSSAVGVVRDPVFFQKVKNVRVLNQTEALDINRSQKQIHVRDNSRGTESWLEYDKLVLATGAAPMIPNLPGIHLKNIFSLHGVTDAEGIKAALDSGRARDVAIIGGGLIGIEVTEALARKGCRVTILEKRSQILRILDREMALLVEKHLESKGVKVLTETNVEGFEGADRVQTVVTDRTVIPTDLVILAAGIQPNAELARKAGLEIGVTGGIKTNERLQTSDPDIYAAGDCVESIHRITGQPCHTPFGSIANKQGRVVAINLCGGSDMFPPVLNSIACQVFDYSIACTGLTEFEARKHNFEPVSVLSPGPDREHFAPRAKTLMLKLVVDAKSRRLLGAQAIGPGRGDKRIDAACLAITGQFTIDQIANLDLCYAPTFSPVMDNLITAANIARNKLSGDMIGITAMEIMELRQKNADFVFLDVRTHPEYEHMRLAGTTHIPLGALRDRLAELPREKPIVTFCNISLRGYEAALILRANGFSDVKVLDGGLEMWPYEKLQ